MVVPAADGNQIFDVRTTVVAPEQHVVDLALIERHLTAPSDTGAVHRSQFSPLGPVHGALGAAEVADHSVGVDAGEGDLGVAAEPAGGLDWQRHAGGGFADPVVVVAVVQGVVIDEQGHVRYPILGGRLHHLEPALGVAGASSASRGSVGDAGLEGGHERVDFELAVRAPGVAVLFHDPAQMNSQ